MKNQQIQAGLIAHTYQNLPAMLFVNFAAASELHAMGIDYFQGFYFRKPSSELIFDEFDITWLNKSAKALT